jgi:hypothetical protein
MLINYIKRRWVFLLVVAIMLFLNLMVWRTALQKPKPIDLPVKVDTTIASQSKEQIELISFSDHFA